MITPHGGKLINKLLLPKESAMVLGDIQRFSSLILDKEQIKDVENIDRGVCFRGKC